MNVLDLLVKGYYKLHNYPHVPVRLLSPARYLVRSSADLLIPKWFSRHPAKISDRLSDVVVSLTSFPARINEVWQVVECMLRQTVRPMKVILWLSELQFQCREQIPEKLRQYENELFEIRLVHGDIRSHKKYQYVCREFPNNNVLLIDDDIYYPSDMLELMLNEYYDGKNVVCQYAYRIQYLSEGQLAPYNKWISENGYYKGYDLFFGSGGGVLFRPNSLFQDITNIDLALALCPSADDIWLNAMVRLAGLPIVKVAGTTSSILPIHQTGEDTRLSTINVSQGANDRQLNAVNNYYQRNIF